MFTKTKSPGFLLKYAAILPMLLLSITFGYSQGKKLALADDKVEEMPRFPGCETEPEATREGCAQKALFQFIGANCTYPAAAKKADIQGMAVVSFIVSKTGDLTDLKLVRDPGYGTGEEALRVVNAMPDWIPGKADGKNVAVEMKLPFRFKMAEKEKE